MIIIIAVNLLHEYVKLHVYLGRASDIIIKDDVDKASTWKTIFVIHAISFELIVAAFN